MTVFLQSGDDPVDLTFWDWAETRIVEPTDILEGSEHDVPIGITATNLGAQDHNDPFCLHVVDNPAAYYLGSTGRGYHLKDVYNGDKANNTDAGSNNNGVHRNQPIAYITDHCWAGGVGQQVYCGAWMYYETVPTQNWVNFFQINATDGGSYWYAMPGLLHNWFSARKVLYNIGPFGNLGPVFDATPNAADPQIPANEWFHVECAYKPGASANGYFEARLNGTPFLTISDFTNVPAVNSTIELYWMIYANAGLANGTTLERWQARLTVADTWQYAPLGGGSPAVSFFPRPTVRGFSWTP
jgi:hypothetical protein